MKRIILSKALELAESEGDYLDEIFGPTGPFADCFPGYQMREGQVEFAHAVDDAINDERTLLTEAACGTGKSVSYLTPIIHAVKSGKKAIIVTAGITLQEQLVKKDLPLLKELLGIEFTFAIAKGFGNYVCSDSMFESEKSLNANRKKLPIFGHRELFDKVVNHNFIDGDLSELDFELPFQVKQLVTTSTEECLGKQCEYFENDCFPRKAKKLYGKADIIVTNYHMYALDLEMRRNSGGEMRFLPEHQIVVFDEFHEGPTIFQDFMAEKVSQGSIKAAVEYLDAKDKRAHKFNLPKQLNLALKDNIERECQIFFKELVDLKNNERKYQARLNRPGMIDGTQLESLLRKAAETYVNAASTMEMTGEGKNWLNSRAHLLKKQANVISGARELENDFLVYYIEVSENKTNRDQTDLFDTKEKATLIREPITPSSALKKELFENPEQPRSIICCSATLCSGKDNPFGYIARQAGIDNFDECVAESPFDYSKMAFIVPQELPEPETYGKGKEVYRNYVSKYLNDTVEMAHGRTLGLFTSYESLDFCHKKLVESGCPYRILRQGEAPRLTLIKQFKEDEESVLLGTDSFWTGIDVPGDSLLAVFIDKIPFPNQTDPILDALKDREGDKFFNKIVIPRTAIKMKQGIGRLIRSVHDRGVVVCCDKRMVSKGYGKTLMRILPYDCKISNNMKDVERYCWGIK